MVPGAAQDAPSSSSAQAPGSVEFHVAGHESDEGQDICCDERGYVRRKGHTTVIGRILFTHSMRLFKVQKLSVHFFCLL